MFGNFTATDNLLVSPTDYSPYSIVACPASRLVGAFRRTFHAIATNAALASEVRDLKEGLETVEERARMELGMVRPNEIFVQISR